MYPLRPPHVFIHRRVYRNPRAVRRLERMLAALGNPPTPDVDVSDTEEVIEAVDMKSFPAHLASRVISDLSVCFILPI